jgi:tRNA1Val (adenine37-N6)-methyltransferase
MFQLKHHTSDSDEPIENLRKILDCAEKQSLFLQRQTTVYPTPNARPKRVLLEFSRQNKSMPVYDELVIEIERHQYSDMFQKLVKDFYLKF